MNKVLLITGGSRGIGAATALGAARAGYAVMLSYREDEAAAASVVTQIEGLGGRALAVQADMAVEADILRLFAACDEAFGPLTALVNNAGILSRRSRVDEMSAERLHHILGINVVGPFLCAREAVRRMSTRHGGQGGAIVNVSSAASRLGAPGEFIDYAASKGALDTFTLGLAKEVATEGIRVNAVRPGVILTDIHDSSGEIGRAARVAPLVPMQRAGTAEEVAASILWLLSEEASYVTATFIEASGGR
jgi:NAD(P)-dependent dehydrogenase (short-subunit alcohol dehydrogenase family)